MKKELGIKAIIEEGRLSFKTATKEMSDFEFLAVLDCIKDNLLKKMRRDL